MRTERTIKLLITRANRNTVVIVSLACLMLCIALPGFSKKCVTAGETDPLVKDFDPVMIKLLRTTEGGKDGPADNLKELLQQKTFTNLIEKHDLTIFSGPMVGDVTSDSVKVWLRTPGKATVQVVCGSKKSKTVVTSETNDFTAILDITGLEPFTTYTYNVLIDGKKALAEEPSFRTGPAKGQKVAFDIAFGSGARYVPKNEFVWSTIAKIKPMAVLLLGDNVYIDCFDTGVNRLMYYRRQLNGHYRRCIGQSAMYAIYDDHDLGKNDCAGGPEPFTPKWKHDAWKVFRENWVNPSYGGGDKNPGCWFSFVLGDVEIFMLDNRYYRDEAGKTMLGPLQKKWLLKALGSSKAKFKILANGTMWTEFADKGGKDSWESFKSEREDVFDHIRKNKITGVIPICGDRHRTEIWPITRTDLYTMYEFVSAKMTNMHTHGTRPQAIMSYNKGNFFGMLSFDFTVNDPTVTYKVVDNEGNVINSFAIPHSCLDFDRKNDAFDPVAEAIKKQPDHFRKFNPNAPQPKKKKRKSKKKKGRRDNVG